MSSPDPKGPSKLSRRRFLQDSLLMGGAAMLAPRPFQPALRVPYTPNPDLVAQQAAIELQFWHQWGGPPNSDALAAMAADFNKLYPNVTVKLTNITDQAQIAAAIGAGSPPDIVHFVLSDAVPEYAHRGALQDLTPLLDKDIPDWKKKLYWYGPEVGSYNGKVYALASANFNISLLWNNEAFKAAGYDPAKPPATLEDLVTYADKLTIVNADGTFKQVGFIP
ncbi:MAG TPA: extracellular solute-binding protein, partial [Aggregatilineales bacterium]|nr:extracellular solute-binding protein [Aggregatilineales bacterium]